MAKVTNTARGARGIRDDKGNLVMIEAGQSAEGEFPASEVKDFKAALAFEAGQQPEAADDDDSGEKPLGRMNKDELLAAAAAPGEGLAAIETVKVDGKDVPVAEATKAQLVEAIEAARAA